MVAYAGSTIETQLTPYMMLRKPHLASSGDESASLNQVRRAYNLRDKTQRLQILQDVALLVGDEEQIQRLHWLVDVAHVLRLNIGMLLPTAYQLGERSQ
jgi:hypothetical protein